MAETDWEYASAARRAVVYRISLECCQESAVSDRAPIAVYTANTRNGWRARKPVRIDIRPFVSSLSDILHPTALAQISGIIIRRAEKNLKTLCGARKTAGFRCFGCNHDRRTRNAFNHGQAAAQISWSDGDISPVANRPDDDDIGAPPVLSCRSGAETCSLLRIKCDLS